jgi:glycerophosphoryl diester phosphodiesterase
MGTSRTAIASHRGGSFLWPENSLTAFRESSRLGLEQIECDVHASADGDPVVMHDATLDRMSDGIGPVDAVPTAAIASLRVRGCEARRVPMLDDLLGTLHGTGIVPRVEIKSDRQGRAYPGFVPRVLSALDRKGMRRGAWIISFAAPTVAEAAAAGGLAGVAWLLDDRSWRALGVRGAIAVAHHYGFPEIGLHEATLDAEGCSALRTAGLGISVWGADREPSIRRALGLGVDVLTTDDPVLAIRLRG